MKALAGPKDRAPIGAEVWGSPAVQRWGAGLRARSAGAEFSSIRMVFCWATAAKVHGAAVVGAMRSRGRANMPYWRLYYHVVWATKGREPWLSGELERMVYGAILGKARDEHLKVHAIGNVDDHIHVVVSIPPSQSVARAVALIKGVSSHYVNTSGKVPWQFAWQEGYGVVSVGERSLRAAIEYVRGQRQHHAEHTVHALYETTGSTGG